MLTVELYSTAELDESIVDDIRICSEVMIPEIFSSKKHPWSSDDVLFEDSAIFEPEADIAVDLEAEDPLPVIRLVITTLYSKRLAKDADERCAKMIAALEKEVLPKGTYQTWVKLRLVYDIGLAVSDVSDIPDIMEDPLLRTALDVTRQRICFDNPAKLDSMKSVVGALVGDSELVGAS